MIDTTDYETIKFFAGLFILALSIMFILANFASELRTGQRKTAVSAINWLIDAAVWASLMSLYIYWHPFIDKFLFSVGRPFLMVFSKYDPDGFGVIHYATVALLIYTYWAFVFTPKLRNVIFYVVDWGYARIDDAFITNA